MTTDTAVEALRRNRADTSAAKKQSVLTALDKLRAQGTEVNLSTVARAAGVSRQFLYTHEALRQAISVAATADCAEQPQPGVRADMTYALRADRRVLAAKVERQTTAIATLKEQITALENQRKRWLGSQLNTGPAVDPEMHAELRITNERLMAENSSLVAQIAELGRLNTLLEAELAASRQAHAEDVARLIDNKNAVTNLAGRR